MTARFSEPMVPLGDPRAASHPFAIDCAEKGTARWVDSRTWAYDFDRDLPAGVRCTFDVRPGLRTLAEHRSAASTQLRLLDRRAGDPAGDPVRGQREATPAQARCVEEEQAFVLVLDGEPTEASVLRQRAVRDRRHLPNASASAC